MSSDTDSACFRAAYVGLQIGRSLLRDIYAVYRVYRIHCSKWQYLVFGGAGRFLKRERGIIIVVVVVVVVVVLVVVVEIIGW